MTARTRLLATLTEALHPVSLDVVDESHHHAGHGGWRPEGETHFRVKVVSAAFAGKTRVDRHRMVNALASGELAAGLHALAIEARTPAEAGLPDAGPSR
ncbi:BolA family transcriptional regulator [Lichenihabitans sp. Uapishka_5]|uniref:BolA family protein n=1 Tax=Lichenihabitans sp. Uapishka_5 TaxID=3037302 RepID=UPI0029E81E1F|nr:BolA family protein [Lichenihabitans sp. Uapishka_5]MDX7952580.1 BolA family transcriptional regulator [Lichenihabitans sp. Uapishka_5]